MGNLNCCSGLAGERYTNLAELKQNLQNRTAKGLEVNSPPLISVTLEELVTPLARNFCPDAFVLQGLAIKIMLEAEGVRSDFERLLGKEPASAFIRNSEQWQRGAKTAPPPLKVKIHNAMGLRNADWSWIPGKGKSDPYCVCEIPGKPESKIQTKVIENNVNPVWDEAHTIPGFVAGDALSFSVYDKDVGKMDDFLGRATLAGTTIMAGFDGTLPLEEAGKAIKASLRVAVPGVPQVHAIHTEVKVDLRKARHSKEVLASLRDAKGDVATFQKYIEAAISRLASDFISQLSSEDTDRA